METHTSWILQSTGNRKDDPHFKENHCQNLSRDHFKMGQDIAHCTGLHSSVESMKYYMGDPSYVLGRTWEEKEDLKVQELDTKVWTVFGA